MHAIEEQTALLEAQLANLDFPQTPSNLYDPLRYFFTLGGKRMRPMLTLMSAELFGLPKQKALSAALAVEIFHNFSLIHDDIMDEAPLRRKQATLHEKWNQSVAILSGDVLLVKAYQELCKQDSRHLPELLQVFNKTAVEVCEGQQMDMDFETRTNVSIDEYIEMIRLKTSVLLGCALELGAIVADTTSANKALIYEFGQHIGIAFQIQDDILDLYADPMKFGKQVGGDVLANKKTLLVLKAIELASPAELSLFHSLQNESVPQQKIDATRALFDQLGVREAAREMMDSHYKIALRALEQIQVEVTQKLALKNLAEVLFNREV
ncbi:MAG: polyprenyl synthetase family protein [Crocinitomicaceae bacterium]|nr:MAG: polyprenyl synthetase family protein [Crocinitomicaceae bacterium]